MTSDGGVVISIFFSEIQNRIKASYVYNLFGCQGEVVEVVISPKLNKFGKRYGFARFTDVEDARLLAVRFDNILIDGEKIHANIPSVERNRDVWAFAAKGGGKGGMEG